MVRVVVMKAQYIEQLLLTAKYPDRLTLDFQITAFGDVVKIYTEHEDLTKCWGMEFQQCVEVSYTTARIVRWGSNNEEGIFVRQDYHETFDRYNGYDLGYFAQDISVSEYEEDDFLKECGYVKCSFQLSMMEGYIVCKDVLLTELSREDITFYWEQARSES